MKLILVDVDGVLTDGRVTLDLQGNEVKSVCYRDLDAIGMGRGEGYEFAFVTGEDTAMVGVLAQRFSIRMVYAGAKDKLATVRRIAEEYGLGLEELLYIGDSNRDAPALEAVGLGVAPRDGSPKARAAARVMTDCNGGEGVLFEVVESLIDGKLRFPGGKA